MHHLPWHKRIANRLILLYLAVGLTPLLLVGSLATYFVYQEARNKAEQELYAEAEYFAYRIEEYFADLEDDIRFVAEHFDQEDLFGKTNLRFLSNFVSIYSDIKTVWLTDNQEKTVALYSKEEMLSDVSLPDQIQGPRSVLDRLQVIWLESGHDSAGLHVLYACVPIITPWQNQSAGFLYFKIRPEKISLITEKAAADKSQHAFILDKHGQLITHSDQKRLLPQFRDKERHLYQDSQPDMKDLLHHSDNNIEYLAAYQLTKYQHWNAVIERSKASVYMVPYKLARLVIIFFVALIGAIMPLAFLFSVKLIKPITRLVYAARELSSGNLAARAEITTQDEIGILANSFNQMVEVLQDREKRYRLLVETAPHGIQENDLAGIITYSNPAHHTMLGYDQGELIGKPIWDLIISEAAQEEFRGFFADLVKEQSEPTPFISKNRTRDGRTRDVQVDWNYKRDRNGAVTGMISIITDITERTLAMEQLRRAHAFNETIIDSMLDSICIINVSDFTIQKVNRTFLETYKLEEQDVLGKTCYEITHHRTSPCTGSQDPCPLFETMQTGRIKIYEHTHFNKDGGKINEEVATTPIRNEEGGIVQVLHISRDITENRILREQFLQAQKMESVGRLAGGIAHDFNNLLTVIIGYSQLALLKLKKDDPVRNSLESISDAGKKAAGLTRQLLAFSRKQVLEMRAVSPNSLIMEMGKLLIRLIGEDIEFNLKIQPQVDCYIMADQAQFEQILMNLAVNARDAMPEGGMLTIETGKIELDSAYAANHYGVVPGPHVVISVSDTGCGMSKEVQEKIFDPFYTTKKPGKGTGLGLSTIYGIVEQHNGHIYVYSEPGKGTTFKLYFPAVADPPPEISEELVDLPGGAETILVVDDDSGIVKYVEMVLTPLGYKIICTTSCEEAIELIATREERVDLLLTDVVMPGMSGRNLAEKIKSLRPEIKIMYMSGYTDDIISRDGVLEPGFSLLNKPLIPGILANKVREVLNGVTK